MFETIAFVSAILGTIFVMFRVQRTANERMTGALASALERFTAELFDAPPRVTLPDNRRTYVQRTPGHVALEGSVAGTAIRVLGRPSNVNTRIALEGFTPRVVFELVVTVGLKGATPSFSLAARPNAGLVASSLGEEVRPA